MQRMASLTMKAPPILGVCGHCYQGIRDGESYVKCKHCIMQFCDNCHEKHPPHHLVDHSIVLTPKMFLLGGPTSKKRCYHCLKNAMCRYDCDECPKSWCADCGQKNVPSFDKHEHREMTTRETPCEQILGTPVTSCESCETNSSINHCGACYSGVGLGFLMICKTCWLEYDIGIGWCRNCFPTVKRSHESSHVYISIKYERSSSNKTDYQVTCGECQKDFSGFVNNNIPKHEHRQFVIKMGSMQAELCGYDRWRVCPLYGVRPDPPKPDLQVGSKKCQRCLMGCVYPSTESSMPSNYRTALAFNNENAFCPVCRWHFCERCITSGTINHHCNEGIQICTWFERRAPDGLDSQEKLKCEFCFRDIYKYYDAHLRCRCGFTLCDECYDSSIPLEHTHGDSSETNFAHFQPPKDQLPRTRVA